MLAFVSFWANQLSFEAHSFELRIKTYNNGSFKKRSLPSRQSGREPSLTSMVKTHTKVPSLRTFCDGLVDGTSSVRQCKHTSSMTATKKTVYSADSEEGDQSHLSMCPPPPPAPVTSRRPGKALHSPPFPPLSYSDCRERWPASHADWNWIPLSLQPGEMAYLLFVSDTILFCKCAVATGQRSPCRRQLCLCLPDIFVQ